MFVVVVVVVIVVTILFFPSKFVSSNHYLPCVMQNSYFQVISSQDPVFPVLGCHHTWPHHLPAADRAHGTKLQVQESSHFSRELCIHLTYKAGKMCVFCVQFINSLMFGRLFVPICSVRT